MTIIEGSILGRYEIRSKIGSGGMGEVYKAEDRVLLRTVAIKFINLQKHLSPEAGKRFLREARAASSINHPNIVTIHEISETDEHAFIVMEYVQGRSLREYVQRSHADAAVMLDVGAQIADALTEAHRRGVLHRDIKPENVLINERGHAKLLDFGLARAMEAESSPVDELAPTQAFIESLTDAGTVVGTLPYMSPEQLRKEPLDHRSDIFSFGIVLHEMLTGRHPFWAGSSFEIAALILGREAVRIGPLNDGLPPGVAGLLARLLEKDRRKRCSSLGEVKNELDDFRRQLAQLEGVRQLAATQQLESPAVERKPRVRRKSTSARPRERNASTAAPRATRRAPSAVAAPSPSPPPARSTAPAAAASSSPLLVASHAPSHSVQSLLHGAPKTILVLPLEAVGAPEGGGFIGIGLASVITTALAKISGLSVLSKAVGAGRINQTGQGARELAYELGATILLEGEVMHANQSIRITARLIDVESGRVIWGEQYSGDMSDIFSIQDAVCESVASVLKVSISTEVRLQIREPATINIDAFELYSKGRAFLERHEVKVNIDFAIQMFEEALKIDPNFASAQAGLGEAFWLKYEATHEQAWIKRAIAASDRALVLDPNRPQVHIALGIVYHGTGKIDRAIEEFEHAIKLQPLSDDAHRWLGRCYREKGDVERAINYFGKSIAIRPGYWENYNELGRYYYMLGRYEDATEQYRRVILIQPDNYHGYNNLGGMYYLLGLYQEAAEMHRKAIEIYPASYAYSNLGSSYFYLGRYDEAIEAYKKAIELDPSDHALYRNLGDAYLRVGRGPEAEEQFQLAIKLLEEPLSVRPDDAQLLGSLSSYHAKLRHEREAATSIERAVSLEPHNTSLMYQKAIVYSLLGDAGKAIECLRDALAHGYSRSEAERDPDLDWLRQREEYQSLFVSL